MEENTIYILFSILRSVFHGKQMSDADKQLVTGDSLKDIIKLASKHDLAHLAALGILNNDLLGEETKIQLQQLTFRAVYRYEKLNYELKQVCEALEKAQIPFLPLKGSVIRKYYPEPWMRTSCDIDVLVSENNLRTAISCLVDNLKYTEHEQNSHDVSLFSPSGNHIELHYDLVEDHIAGNSSEILADIWNVVTAKEGCFYHHEMSDEMFYFYHIAHMAKHFENGGCGIRPFIDLWILDNIQEADNKKRDKLLKQGELLTFANVARKLSRIWLSGEQHDFVTKQMEDYILRGGVYGNSENRIMVQQQKKGGRMKYAFSKIFLPYDVIKFHYPVLEKHRWLTPFMEVRRWFKLIFCGHLKRSTKELKYNSSISTDEAMNTQRFLRDIGL
jgi:hypothetical protein